MEPETGFIYLRNRYYDPTTAQFTTPDPLFTITGSRYGFAGNDPVNGYDPLGLFGWSSITHAVSSVTHTVSHAVHHVAHDINNDIINPVRRTNITTDLAVAGAVAGVVALTISTGGLGDIALAGVGLDAVATGASAFAAGSSIAVAYSDCREHPGTARCFADGAAAVLSTVGGGLSLAGTNLAASASELAELGGPMRMYGDAQFGLSSVGWGVGGLFMPGDETAGCDRQG